MTRHAKGSQRSALRALGDIVGEDCYLTPFDTIADQIARLNDGKQKDLLALCREALATPSLRDHEGVRVAAVKVLVALLPDSFDEVRSWLTEKRSKNFGEIRFSLFCYLDEAQASRMNKSERAQVLALIGNYLEKTKTDAGESAWMAGDLLGDHWDLSESLPLLMRAAARAQYPAGRIAAFHGLELAFMRLNGQEDRRRIQHLLERISKTNPERRVRRAAELALEHVVASRLQ